MLSFSAATGQRITRYLLNVNRKEASDSEFASGNPGLGFFIDGATGVNRDSGFSGFTATDQ